MFFLVASKDAASLPTAMTTTSFGVTRKNALVSRRGLNRNRHANVIGREHLIYALLIVNTVIDPSQMTVCQCDGESFEPKNCAG